MRPIPFRRLLITTSALVTAALAAARDAEAIWYSSLDFFETQVPGACMADNVASRGSYVRQYRGPSGECPGLATYHVVHGDNAHPWSTESFTSTTAGCGR
jgi:hypothetical protein